MPISRVLISLLNSAPIPDAVAGDIEERYRAGRSTWWALRQVVVATLINIWDQSRQHPFTVPALAVTGWLIASTAHLALVALVTISSAHFIQPDVQSHRAFWLEHTVFDHSYAWVTSSLTLIFAGYIVRVLSRTETSSASLALFFWSICLVHWSGQFYWAVLPIPHLAPVAMDGWTTAVVLALSPLLIPAGASLGIRKEYAGPRCVTREL